MTKKKTIKKRQPPRKGTGRLSRPLVIKAIEESQGILSVVAKRCGVNRSSIYVFLNKDGNQDLLEMVQDEREKLIDVAENQLFSKVNTGEDWAVKYTLGTIGRHRGYVEKKEVEHEGTVNIKGYVGFSPDEWDDVNYDKN